MTESNERSTTLRYGVTDHELFPVLVPYFNIEVYDRDGGHPNPRKRIELKDRLMSDELVEWTLSAVVQCVRCGKEMHPFRARKPGLRGTRPSHIYCAVACPLNTNMACARGPEARQAYLDIIAAVRRQQFIHNAWREAAFAEAMEEVRAVRHMYAPDSDGFRLCDYIVSRLKEVGRPPSGKR
jgi:hypothetical protein